MLVHTGSKTKYGGQLDNELLYPRRKTIEIRFSFDILKFSETRFNHSLILGSINLIDSKNTSAFVHQNLAKPSFISHYALCIIDGVCDNNMHITFILIIILLFVCSFGY